MTEYRFMTEPDPWYVIKPMADLTPHEVLGIAVMLVAASAPRHEDAPPLNPDSIKIAKSVIDQLPIEQARHFSPEDTGEKHEPVGEDNDQS